MNQPQSTPLNVDYLNAAGLNLQAVFNLADLPEDAIEHFSDLGVNLSDYAQLILIGHKGRQLWEKVEADIAKTCDPIDHYTLSQIKQLFREFYPEKTYAVIYPGDKAVNLQKLGRYAGWHHTSPFRVGIHPEWGSWFAYRAAILANSNFISQPVAIEPALQPSPCEQCEAKPCITRCPADACSSEQPELHKCLNYRKQNDSRCGYTCLAREACPVGKIYQYDESQMRYHYSISLKMITRG